MYRLETFDDILDHRALFLTGIPSNFMKDDLQFDGLRRY